MQRVQKIPEIVWRIIWMLSYKMRQILQFKAFISYKPIMYNKKHYKSFNILTIFINPNSFSHKNLKFTWKFSNIL